MATSWDGWWLGDYVKHSRFEWRERFIWWPKKSHVSGRRIWFKRAWYGTKLIAGPAGTTPVKIERWLTDDEYMWNQLTSAE